MGKGAGCNTGWVATRAPSLLAASLKRWTRGTPMVTWHEFAAAEPELAVAGRSLLFQFGVGLAFLATVRKDGAPRLHPLCPVLSNDRLFVLITPTSPKRYDLLR